LGARGKRTRIEDRLADYAVKEIDGLPSGATGLVARIGAEAGVLTPCFAPWGMRCTCTRARIMTCEPTLEVAAF
jgi:hypothetical protein